MKVVAGVTADERGDDAVACAQALARSMRATLVLVAVHPTPWRSEGGGGVDAEWRAYLEEQSRAALVRAERRLDPRVDREVRVVADTSTGRALGAVASDDAAASLIVVGPADGGEHGRLQLGSTAGQLLHGASVPVLLVPRGYQDVADSTVPTRISVAYQRSLESAEALRAAGQLCRRTGAPLRLLTLVVQPPRLLPSYQRALDELRGQARAWLDEAAAQTPLTTPTTAEVAEGDDVEEALSALDLDPHELLVCGSGTAGPLRRVFLGDTAHRILRAATTPVVVVPRQADAELESTRRIPRVT